MAQITLYLDEETAHHLKKTAAAAGKSQSQWVAELIRSRIRSEWPAHVARLAGAWADLPTAEEIRLSQPPDTPREVL